MAAPSQTGSQANVLYEAVPGLTPEVLADLHDCILAFGTPTDTGGKIRRIGFEGMGVVPIYASAKVSAGEGISIIISRIPEGMNIQGARMIALTDQNRSGVAVERDVTAEEIRGLIDAVDAPMREAEMFDPAGRRRKIHYDDAAKGTLDTAKIFSRPGTILRLAEEDSFAEVLIRFDTPQDLVPMFVYGGSEATSYGALVHIRDPKVKAVVDATRAVANAWGFASPSEIARFDAKGMGRFFREVHSLVRTTGTN